ncbi:MAG: hypothetical protein K9N23_21585 [Akkermansiaceae bacterium]|nr:hypothetical protein [Akkermansiaceae bacterium]
MINHPNDKLLALMSLLRPRILLAMACVLPAMTKADDFPPPGFTEMGSEQSPGGSFKIIHFKRDPNDNSSASQGWLQALKPEFKTQPEVKVEDHHALAADLPDDSRLAQVGEVDHYREEADHHSAVPAISKVFETLQFLMPLPLGDVARKLPERMPMEREDLALELGFLIADGFLVVQTGQLERVGELAKELTRYAKALGIGSRVSPHAAGLLELAGNKNVPQLKKELAAMQLDVEIELGLLKDEDLALLITLGGWIRGFEVAVAAVDQRFTPERARKVMREDLADCYAGVVGGMPAHPAKRPKFLAMRDALAELCHAMTLAEGQEPTAAQVSAIRKQAAKLVALALQRRQ